MTPCTTLTMSAYYSTVESISLMPEDDRLYTSVPEPSQIHRFMYLGELSQEFPASASGHWNTSHVGINHQPRDNSRPQASAVTSVPFWESGCSSRFGDSFDTLGGYVFDRVAPVEYRSLHTSPQPLDELAQSPTLEGCIQSRQPGLSLTLTSGQPIFFGPALQNNAADHVSEGAEQLKSPPQAKTGCEVVSHGLVQALPVTSCQECYLQFPTRAGLDGHAKVTDHAPYRCQCGTTFSRLDVLTRHIKTFRPAIFYPCPHCKKYRGSRAFVRRDHLTQHLRGYHNIESGDESDYDQSQKSPRKREKIFKCPHETCFYSSGNSPRLNQVNQPLSNGISRTFQTRGEFTKHLREAHDESLFPCTEIGCARVGGKGFFGKRDLLNHARDHHSNFDFQSNET